MASMSQGVKNLEIFPNKEHQDQTLCRDSRIHLVVVWTLTQKLEKQPDGMYTRMLRMVLNISWQSHTTNIDLYDGMPKLTQKIAERRLRLAGHCIKHPEEISSNLVLWQPTHERLHPGRPATNFIDILKKDTGLNITSEIRAVMMERDIWRGYVSLVRLENRPR